VYALLDAAVAAFAGRSGLSCPQGCGHCCLAESVEATVLECLPLAFLLFHTGQADLMLQRLAEHGDDRHCVLYRRELTLAGLWGCSQYMMRPVVCRLFGFAGNPGREGIGRLAMCRVMKEAAELEHFELVTDDPSAPMPLFARAGLRITALHPGFGTDRLPINVALHQALQKVGMSLDLQGGSSRGRFTGSTTAQFSPFCR
jgi:uncharacterized protein